MPILHDRIGTKLCGDVSVPERQDRGSSADRNAHRRREPQNVHDDNDIARMCQGGQVLRSPAETDGERTLSGEVQHAPSAPDN
ncbi:hypothetical protein, partial [Frankia sp. Cr1]|uniref:hypothetical protein n=1 Tax=Frankia sp. Cr1 TaxID=3073931 RepID=UPI002AD2F155